MAARRERVAREEGERAAVLQAQADAQLRVARRKLEQAERRYKHAQRAHAASPPALGTGHLDKVGDQNQHGAFMRHADRGGGVGWTRSGLRLW